MSDEAREGGAPDNPGVIAPPPLIYAGALAAGLLINHLRPITFLPRKAARLLGWPLIGGGLVLGRFGVGALHSAKTNVDPYKPVTAIVDTGPYQYTRNPLYVSMTLIYTGISILANAPPPALMLPAVLHMMRRGVIEREERYLEGKFGDEYLTYKTRVRRWI